MTHSLTLLVTTAAAFAVALTQVPSGRPAQPPQRVLFIGNSLTYFQDGIYSHLEKMAAAASPSRTIHADKAVFGGQY
jgi:hypothetical protein